MLAFLPYCATSAGAILTRIRAMPVQVTMETARGRIVFQLANERAPITASHFAMLVRAGVFSHGASFYRSVAPERDVNPVPISIVQGGIGTAASAFPPIRHESTWETGIRHQDGTISMARGRLGTASTEFFVCLGDNPELDYGGARVADNQGFAAFGKVVDGMDVVRAIHSATIGNGGGGTAREKQLLDPVIEVIGATVEGRGRG